MDHALFRAHNRPATFGFHFPHLCVGLGPVEPHTVTVWDLIKPVLSCDGANFDGFEENVEAGIAGQWLFVLSVI